MRGFRTLTLGVRCPQEEIAHRGSGLFLARTYSCRFQLGLRPCHRGFRYAPTQRRRREHPLWSGCRYYIACRPTRHVCDRLRCVPCAYRRPKILVVCTRRGGGGGGIRQRAHRLVRTLDRHWTTDLAGALGAAALAFVAIPTPISPYTSRAGHPLGSKSHQRDEARGGRTTRGVGGRCRATGERYRWHRGSPRISRVLLAQTRAEREER